ncbi:hypothetical protein [Bradyrhizobium cosmicum]|uniref:hypothetical protein n=1 Tax=Bradyrhizobium cosmicum TaxID=1404864 RepID=UPI0028EE2F21|nr:hypothetical protein [Bradyrhizobium cosmicum]
MIMRITPEQVATQIPQAPAAGVNAAAGVTQPALPEKKPLPADLARALGQTERGV